MLGLNLVVDDVAMFWPNFQIGKFNSIHTYIWARDEFGPKYFGPGLKRAMEIMARPDQGPKPMLAFGPGRAWANFKIDGPGKAGPKLENIMKKITISLVFQFKIAKYDVFHNF